MDKYLAPAHFFDAEGGIGGWAVYDGGEWSGGMFVELDRSAAQHSTEHSHRTQYLTVSKEGRKCSPSASSDRDRNPLAKAKTGRCGNGGARLRLCGAGRGVSHRIRYETELYSTAVR